LIWPESTRSACLAAEIGGQDALREAGAQRDLAGNREGILDSQQRPDLGLGEAAALIGRPGADHALPLLRGKVVAEGEIVGQPFLAQIVEDRELGGATRVEPAAQMVEPMPQQVIIGALDESIGIDPLGPVPDGVDLQALPALPGVADAPVERVQHGERELHAGDRYARGVQPLATAAHNVPEIGIVQGLRHQPLDRPLDQRVGGGTVRFARAGFDHARFAHVALVRRGRIFQAPHMRCSDLSMPRRGIIERAPTRGTAADDAVTT
jgi:hypothetical protein